MVLEERNKMANQEHLDILNQGVDVWNEWREKHYELVPALDRIDLSWRNLSKANLRQTDLSWTNLSRAQLENADLRYAGLVRTNFQEADLSGADLSKATLQGAFLQEASLKKAMLKEANMREANLSGADLSEACLIDANLYGAILFKANLSRAKLTGATLCGATFVETNLTAATLTNCLVYGISVWKAQLQEIRQDNLVITPPNEPTITVDSLEVAQFVYLLLNNEKIRDVIDTITSKVVLILVRFTPERKAILDTLRDELRKHNYSPVVFDFERPESRDFTETLRILAHLARFIIADLTDPNSIPQELQAIIPDLEVPVQPLLLEAKREYAMFVDFRKYPWVLPVSFYTDLPSLLASLNRNIIDAAEKKVAELALMKAKRLEK